MGQILHGSATTTHAIRAAIQRSKAPLKELVSDSNASFPRLTAASTRWGSAVQTKGFGLELVSARNRLMAALDDNACSHSESLNCFGRFGNRLNASHH
jgi:hypothetical protein